MTHSLRLVLSNACWILGHSQPNPTLTTELLHDAGAQNATGCQEREQEGKAHTRPDPRIAIFQGRRPSPTHAHTQLRVNLFGPAVCIPPPPTPGVRAYLGKKHSGFGQLYLP